MKVLECKPDVGGFKDCGVVFSGLDQDVAGDIGEYSSKSHLFSFGEHFARWKVE